ncbi:MAG TPA: UDP-glucuronic acid decarboxylase family protein [Anaerolineales bacterium]|nr:UDP-glucuronic acid decarboxylase family protein [Anaerolineales bacterium]
MRILLTGAAGFLGSHLCDRLLAEGHEVVGVDNYVTGNPGNLAHLSGNDRFTFIEQDVSEAIPISGKLDAVLHFASPASPNPKSPYGYPNLPVETLRAGSLGTLNALELAMKNGARFLMASTSEVYGDPLEHPQTEKYWGHVDPVGLRSMYDEAKRFSEALTMAYFRSKSTDTHIVRIFNTYGPRMSLDDGRVVPNFIQQALRRQPLTIYGDGVQTRSFCYVDDLVEGIYRLLLSDEHMPVNIGNPNETSILEFARLINRLTGNAAGLDPQPDKRLGSDPQRRRPDIGRAKSLLGWEPKVGLEEGLRRTIAYFTQKIGVS